MRRSWLPRRRPRLWRRLPGKPAAVAGIGTFRELEHTNWERSAEAYTVGFGPLTRQTIPTLLAAARVPRPGQRVLDVASGPGFVAEAVLEAARGRRWQGPDAIHVVALDFAR